MKKFFVTLFFGCTLLPAQAAPVVEIDRIVAIVNKQAITELQLEAHIQNAIRALKAQNIPIPPQQLLTRQVLDQMITEEVELQSASARGISVDAHEVEQTLQRLAQKNHTTVAGLLKKLRHGGEDDAAFRDSVRREMILAKLREADVDSRITVSDTEVDQVLKSAHHANRTEYRLANIVVRIPERVDSKKRDELAKKAETVLEALKAGKSFAELAATYSDAPNALKGGELGWRAATSLPSELASLLEQMSPGQHTNIFRTQQGFLIFQLQEKRKGSEPVVVEQYHTRHILIRSNEAVSETDAKTKITEIRQQLLQGADFADLAKRYSEDASRSKGGELGWVNPADMVPEFSRAMLALPLNTLSEPVRTPFGWHLILVDAKRNEDISNEYERNQVKQQIRARKAEQAFMDWIQQLRDSAYVEDHLNDK